MSINIHPYQHFTTSLHHGNLHGVHTAAAIIAQNTNLLTALTTLLTIRTENDTEYEHAAIKWLARFALERPGAHIEELRITLNVLMAYRYNPDGARQALTELCERYQLPNIVGATIAATAG